jgi:hypothetical protein
MSRDAVLELAKDLLPAVSAGVDTAGTSRLTRHAATFNSLAGQDPEVAPIADAAQRTVTAEPDEVPAPLLDLVQATFAARAAEAEPAEVKGELKSVPEGGFWATPMPAELLYKLVPETRPFAKRAKPPEQIETLEAVARLAQVADLRLVQPFLKMLTEKASNTVADAVARLAIPAYGPVILPDLWPTLAPENRTFIAAYKIDVEATLARLLEKSGEKKGKGGGDKGGNVMKAVEKLMTTVNEDGSSIGPESLPIIKLALKHAPDQAFRRKLADILANMGPRGSDALTDLIDAFEHTGLTRDYYLIRPMVVLGKESQDVADAVIRAMGDRDATVRLMAVFNIGQMGSIAQGALQVVEDLAEADPDPKVRETALKTLNKLRIRFGLIEPEPVGEEV